MTRVTPGAIVTTPCGIWRVNAPVLWVQIPPTTLRIKPKVTAGSVRKRPARGFGADPDTPSLSAEAYFGALEQLQQNNRNFPQAQQHFVAAA